MSLDAAYLVLSIGAVLVVLATIVIFHHREFR